MLFNFLVNSAVNWGPLSDTMLFSNLYNFHTLSLNNCANPPTDISSIVATKCVILDNLLQTTRITFFSATNSNFVIKSTIKYIYGFFSILLKFNFLTLLFYSSSSDTYHNYLHIHIFPHLLLLLATNSSLLPTLSSSIFVRHSLHWRWKSTRWAQSCIYLWNNLGFRLCAVLSVYHIVAILENRKKSEIGVSTDVRNRLATELVTLKVRNIKLSFDIWLVLYIYFILYS